MCVLVMYKNFPFYDYCNVRESIIYNYTIAVMFIAHTRMHTHAPTYTYVHARECVYIDVTLTF